MSDPGLGKRSARFSAQFLLRLQLALLRANSLTLASIFLLLAVFACVGWTSYAVGALQAERTARNAQAARTGGQAQAPLPGVPALPGTAPMAVAMPEQDNLAAFYGTLGERRYAEQQVKTLFGLAAKSGLSLAQGEYKSVYDRNAHVWTYQVNLPVKGSYAAIWQFAFGALRAIPFASLDDIGFRREAIGDPQVEARLRLTLYLSDRLADHGDHSDHSAGAIGGAP
jgi:hypothetical protein